MLRESLLRESSGVPNPAQLVFSNRSSSSSTEVRDASPFRGDRLEDAVVHLRVELLRVATVRAHVLRVPASSDRASSVSRVTDAEAGRGGRTLWVRRGRGGG